MSHITMLMTRERKAEGITTGDWFWHYDVATCDVCGLECHVNRVKVQGNAHAVGEYRAVMPVGGEMAGVNDKGECVCWGCME